METSVGFGVILGLKSKPERQPNPPATVYYRNQVVLAHEGHADAAIGKWVSLLVRDNKAYILLVMAVDLADTHVYYKFEISTRFSIVDDQTVHNMFLGSVTVVPEHRKYVSERRGYVLGTISLNEKGEIEFHLKDPPDNYIAYNSPFPPDADYDWMQRSDAPPEPSNPPPDYDASALSLPTDRSNSEDSGISSLASMTISQTSSPPVSPTAEKVAFSEEQIVFEDEAKHPGLGLPYRQNAAPMPPMPKPVFDISNDDDEKYLASKRFQQNARRPKAEKNRKPSDEYLRSRDSQPIPLVLPEEKEFDTPDKYAEAKMETAPSDEATMESNGTSSGMTGVRFTKRLSQSEVKANNWNSEWYGESWAANRGTNGYGWGQEAFSDPYGAGGKYSKKKSKFVNPYDLHESKYSRKNNSTTKSSFSTQSFGATRSPPQPPRITQRRSDATTRAYDEPVFRRSYGDSYANSSSPLSYGEPLPYKPATMEVPKPPSTPSPKSSTEFMPPKDKRFVISQPGQKSTPRRRFTIVGPPLWTPPSE